LTVAAVAKPAIISVASSTCLISSAVTEFPSRRTAGTTTTPSNEIVALAGDDDVFARRILVTTVVVSAGVVYRVTEDVAAAVRANTFDDVAINYYLLLLDYSTFLNN
jgi:hypothetical protein